MGFAASDMAHHHPDMISEKDVIIGAPAFEAEQIASGIGLILGLLIFGIALLRARPAIPRWLGWTGVAGAVLQLAPLPAMPVVSGLQIELLRGTLLIGLGLLAVRSSRTESAAAAVREPASV